MATTTELIPQDPPITGGKQIRTYRYRLANFRIQKMLQATSRLIIGTIEADSNNMSGDVSARDARMINEALSMIRFEWKHAKKNTDNASGSHENIFTVLVAMDEEIQRQRNVKLQSLNMELIHFFRVSIGVQAGDTQVWVGNDSREDVEGALVAVEEVAKELIGDGKQIEGSDPEEPKFNTGMKAPNYTTVGRLNPPPGEGGVEIREASSGGSPNLPDSPDTPSDSTITPA